MEHRSRPGDRAPDLELLDQDGEARSLAQLHGQPVIIYFFPKASTPGCTTEVCDFRDDKAALAGAGHAVLGVSADPPSALREFAGAHQVKHDLRNRRNQRPADDRPPAVNPRGGRGRGFSCSAESSPAPLSHVGSLSRKESEPT